MLQKTHLELEDGKIFDWSYNFFDLSPFRTSKIKVISPNGGEVWTEGEQHEIKWTSQNISGNVNIYFHGQYWIGNSAWEELIEINDFIANTSNTGSFIWTIPDYIYIYGNCVIRVHDASDPEIFDQSDSFISCPPKPNTYNGNNVTLDLGDGTNINFDKVDSAGITFQFIGDLGASPPSGNEIFPSNSPKHYYIETTSTFSGNIQLCFAYSDSVLTEVDESNLQFHVYDTHFHNGLILQLVWTR